MEEGTKGVLLDVNWQFYDGFVLQPSTSIQRGMCSLLGKKETTG